MRDYLGAPIEFDFDQSGYRYAKEGEHPYELPGLWFNASELLALMTVQRLLAEVQPGLLESHITPLRNRIEKILKSKYMGSGEVDRRVRILGMAARRVDPEKFRTIAVGVLQRKRLHIVYHSRGRDETTNRDISPQRLVHYRDNWYLDAWDHGRRGLRSFSIDRIKQAHLINKPAKEIADKTLDSYFASAFGIFSGIPKQKAILRFTKERARWVADEVWHPQQEGCIENECYLLKIPYSDPRELVMDILKHGPDVEVVAPECLRAEVAERLEKALSRYSGKKEV
jgi:predicted DNA-binding transcriptional regulator YafY